MNENERAELDAENDGYTNDFQRAAAWSRLTTHVFNHRARAEELVQAGKVVVLACSPVYCRSTDGLIGESAKVILVCEDRAVANAFVTALYSTDGGELGDESYEILPLVPPPGMPPSDSSDECPF